jgi:hypothetical protein
MVIFRRIILRLRNFWDMFVAKKITYFSFSNILPKLCPLCGNVSQTGHGWQYDTARKKKQFACRITKTRLQTDSHNIQYLLLFQGQKQSYSNAAQCRITRTLFFSFSFIITFYYFIVSVPPFDHCSLPT